MELACLCASTSVHGCLTRAWHEINQCPLCNICFPGCKQGMYGCGGGKNASEEVSNSSSFPFQLPTACGVVECGLLLSLTAPFQDKDASQSSKAEEK